MEPRLEGLLGKAPLKGCLWMNMNEEDSEGNHDEDGQQRRLWEMQGLFAGSRKKEPFVYFSLQNS